MATFDHEEPDVYKAGIAFAGVATKLVAELPRIGLEWTSPGVEDATAPTLKGETP